MYIPQNQLSKKSINIEEITFKLDKEYLSK